MPRLFAGRVDVIPINVEVPDPQPLAPTSANFTQSAYMVLSVGLIYACAVVARNNEFRRHFLRANLVAAAMLVLTGVLDLATQGTDLLAPFRNANYALVSDAAILGSKRVVGLMPEASTFGAACVGILSVLVFLRPSFRTQTSNRRRSSSDNRAHRDDAAIDIINRLCRPWRSRLDLCRKSGLAVKFDVTH